MKALRALLNPSRPKRGNSTLTQDQLIVPAIEPSVLDDPASTMLRAMRASVDMLLNPSQPNYGNSIIAQDQLIAPAIEPSKVDDSVSTTLPTMRASADMLLPTELWREVFVLASTVPSKDEFSTEGAAYNVMSCDDSTVMTIPSLNDHTLIFSTRHSIVLVCKYWHSIGMPLLWSHLQLNLAGTAPYIDAIYDKLGLAQEFALNITRLDVSLPFTAELNRYLGSEKIIERLPGLKILTCPLTFGLSINDRRIDPLEILVLTRAYSPAGGPLPTISFWLNVRVMSINFGPEYTSSLTDAITFPRLENLSINDTGGKMEQSINKLWNVPSLRILSINTNYRSCWLPFLSKCAGHICKLELKSMVGTGPPLFMTKLKALYIADDMYIREWTERITASQLGRFGAWNLPWGARDPGLCISNALDLFPTVKELSLCGYRIASGNIRRGIITPDYIESWESRGIKVELRSSAD